MPGLLETPPDHFGTTKYFGALIAEFLGSMMFALMGGAALYVAVDVLNSAGPNVVMAALANGLALSLAIFAVANISGGHITPTVTIATMITGHISILKGIAYMFSQVLGAIFASLVMAGLVPGASVGMGDTGPGCFAPGAVNNAQLFGWEFFNSFILVSVVYAVAIGSPSFGNVAPLAAGLTLTAVIFGSAAFSGGGVSPARVLGPACVFHCYWNRVGFYLLGQIAGAIVAGAFACPLYGGHAMWMDPFLPWGHTHYESKLEADGSFRGVPPCRKTAAMEEEKKMKMAAMDKGDMMENGDATMMKDDKM